MTIVSNAETYKTNDLYLWDNRSVTKSTATAKTAATAATESQAIKNDTVTLSSDVSIARLRESLGLLPTGKLSREDFETVADSDEKSVEEALESAMAELGIDENQTISLSLNDKGKIVIKESFSKKTELEKQLNNDEDFMANFSRLSANSEILDFTTELQTSSKSMNLLSFMNNESDEDDWSSLLKLAETYNELKSGKDPLEIITSISHQETPFEFVHKPEEETAS